LKLLKKILLSLMAILVMMAIPAIVHASTDWQNFDGTMMGHAKHYKIIKYSPTGWGNFEAWYQRKYFTNKQNPQYKYTKENRTLLIRYQNPNKHLHVKYNYRKFIIRHGHKTPTYTTYYKIGNASWVYANTIKYWLEKPTRF
jgi:hypothetical protein